MKMNTVEQANIVAWNMFGNEYARRSVISCSDIHYGLCVPGESELKLLPSVQNKRILDVGCGTGENGVILARMGAKVVGIEPTPFLYQQASKVFSSIPHSIVLEKAWGDQMVKNWAPYDIVMFVGSSEYIPLDTSFFQHLAEITTKGSHLLLARMHPFWTSLFLHETDREIVQCYFDCGREDYVDYGEGKNHFVRFHYSIGDILQLFLHNGWSLDRLVEPAPVLAARAPFYMPGCYDDPTLSKRLKNIPMTIILTFHRIDGNTL